MKHQSLDLPHCTLCQQILSQIPKRYQHGLNMLPTVPVAIDCSESLVVIGANLGVLKVYAVNFTGEIGLLFIYNRKLGKVSTIKLKEQIVTVKTVSNDYDYVAVGFISGNVLIHRLPSSLPNLSRKLASHLVKSHTSRVTTLEWSSDAHALFSGDIDGLVVGTELQFDPNSSHSAFVCSLDSEISQIVYTGETLLLSTLTRAYICSLDINSQPVAIGTTERKLKDKFGVQFCVSESAEKLIIASRPGLRLWKANCDGNVLETVIFKDSVAKAQMLFGPQVLSNKDSDSKPISLASSLTSLNSEFTGNLNFLQLYRLGDSQFVTFCRSHLFVIDLINADISYHYCFPDPIICISVCPSNSEIFVLCERHYLARLGEWLDNSISGETLVKSQETSRSSSPLFGKLISAKNSVISKVSKSSASDKIETESVSSASGIEPYQMPIDNNAASSIPSNSGKPNGKILDFLAKIDLNLPTKKGSKSDSKTNNVDQVMDTKYNTESGPTNPPTVNTEVTVIRKTTKSRKAGGSVISSDNLDDQTNISEPNDSNENSKSSLIPKRNSGKSTVVQNDEINLYSHVVETLSDQPAMLKSFTPDLPEINLENLTESSQADKVKEFVEGSDQPISRQFLENFLNTSVLGDYQSVLEPTVEFSEKHEELPEVSELTELPTQPNLSLSEPSQTESFPLAPDECSLPEANRSDLDIPVSKPERKTEADYNAILLKEISSKRKWFDPINVSAYTNHSTGASSNGENLPLATFPQNQYELDIWSRCEAKVTVVSLTASKNYIAYTDSRKAVHYSVLDRPQLEWKSLKNDERADLMAVSSNGQIVWRLLAGVVWALVRPHRRKPRGQEWVEAASDVVTIAVSNTSGWYVKSTGEVFAQMGLSSSRPRSKEMNVASDHNLVQLSCSTEAVWGLRDNGRISVRIGLSMENPIGLDWVEFCSDVSHPFVQLSLHGEFCFAIDSSCELWFTNGISHQRPLGTTGRWWQVRLPSSALRHGPSRGFGSFLSGGTVVAYQQIPSLSASVSGVLLSYGKEILYSRGSLTGHRWIEPISKSTLSSPNLLMASGNGFINLESDFIWLLRQKGEILAFQPESESLVPMESDSRHQFSCLSAAQNVLWAIDKRGGGAFIRVGMEPILTPLGSGWVPLDTSQLGPVAFRYVCCSSTGVWVVDSAGQVHLRLGVEPLLSGGLPPAWITAEDFTDGKTGIIPEFFTQIHCSYDGLAVWGLSKNGSLWCRLGISPEIPVGLEWTMIAGLECQSLAVGSNSLWVLTTDNRLYSRQKITLDDPTGDYWKSIPSGNLKFITVTPDNVLWAIDANGRLSKLVTKVYRHNSYQSDPDEVGNDWEFV